MDLLHKCILISAFHAPEVSQCMSVGNVNKNKNLKQTPSDACGQSRQVNLEKMTGFYRLTHINIIKHFIGILVSKVVFLGNISVG